MYFALFLCQRTCVVPIKLDISTNLTGCVPTNPNVFANINTMAETFPSPDLHIVYLPLLEGPSNKGPAHLQCQNSQCHIFFIKRITTTLKKTIKLGRLFVTSLRVRTRINGVFKLYTYSFRIQKRSYVYNK